MNDPIQSQPMTQQAQPAQQAPLQTSQTPALPASMPVPEKFRDPDTGELRAEALIRSYKELERKLSAMPRPPADPDEYCIDCSHGLFGADREVNKKLFEKGLTLEQVQAVYDLAAEKFVPMILDLAEEFRADREVERLIAAFGGEEKWAEVSRQLLSYGKKNLPENVLSNLSNSFEGVMALYRMMQGQEPALAKTIAMPGGNGAVSDENDLHEMMRDPRYYRDRDPSYVAKVTDGFKRLYGDK